MCRLRKIILVAALLMAFSDSEATACAGASGIVTDLRNMISASLMFYADSMDEINEGNITVNVEHLKPYLDNLRKYDNRIYFLEEINDKWWVGIHVQKWIEVDGKEKSPDQKDRLKSKAVALGLLGEKDVNEVYTGQDIVWLLAR
jgi:hypothetical protein